MTDHNAETSRIGGLVDVRNVLLELECWLDGQADADGDVNGFTPNEPMRHLLEVQRALGILRRLPARLAADRDHIIETAIVHGYVACERGQNLQSALRQILGGSQPTPDGASRSATPGTERSEVLGSHE